MKLKVIGISGTNGSGKDTLGKFLADECGWKFISITEILRDDLRQRGLLVTRKNLRELSASWRRQFGHGVLVDKALKIYKLEHNEYRGLVISSLRNPGEAERIHELGGVVVWSDGDPRIRYKRIQKNAPLRSRAGEDNKTYEQFLVEEKAEMEHHDGDSATLNMAGVKAKADIFINNNSGDIDVFKTDARKALSEVL